MSKAEAKELANGSVPLATYRDSSSGGCVRIVDITADKVTKEYTSYKDLLFQKGYAGPQEIQWK